MKLIKICGHDQLDVSDEKPKSPRRSTFLAKSMRSSISVWITFFVTWNAFSPKHFATRLTQNDGLLTECNLKHHCSSEVLLLDSLVLMNNEFICLCKVM